MKARWMLSVVVVGFGLSAFGPATFAADQSRTNSAPTQAQLQAQEASPTARQSMARVEQVRVWVDPKTKIYYLPGDRFYGKTTQGKFMTEKEAIAEGYQDTKQSAVK